MQITTYYINYSGSAKSLDGSNKDGILLHIDNLSPLQASYKSKPTPREKPEGDLLLARTFPDKSRSPVSKRSKYESRCKVEYESDFRPERPLTREAWSEEGEMSVSGDTGYQSGFCR